MIMSRLLGLNLLLPIPCFIPSPFYDPTPLSAERRGPVYLRHTFTTFTKH
ncbi:hypothetical protein M758_3G209500 [Ceratodon purpureus]|nr:hypothetical protein M758_3G209500 [Ceratodon purpureus]